MTLTGIKRACAESRHIAYDRGLVTRIYVDRSTGRVIAETLPANNWIVWSDPDVLEVCTLYAPATMAEIRRAVLGALPGDRP